MFMPSSVNINKTYAICPGDSFVTGHISLSMFHVNWRRIIMEINALEIGAATATVPTAETEGLLDHEV